MPHTQAQDNKTRQEPATAGENFFVTALAALSPIAVGTLYFPTPTAVTDRNPMSTEMHSPTHLTPTHTSSCHNSEKCPASHAHYQLHLGQVSFLGDAFHRHHHGHLVEEDYRRN